MRLSLAQLSDEFRVLQHRSDGLRQYDPGEAMRHAVSGLEHTGGGLPGSLIVL